jgi:DNA-binding transcriptional MerR regulator
LPLLVQLEDGVDLEFGSRCRVGVVNVSDIAREVGIAPSAVRFYERKGVLPEARRRSNGYRIYTEDDLRRLRLVTRLRRLGLDLSTAGRLAGLCATGHCDDMARDLAPLISEQRAEIARQQRELAALDHQLEDLARTLAEPPARGGQ